MKENEESVKELLIIDPYFFKKPSNQHKQEEYFNLIISIFKQIDSQVIKIITNREYADSDLLSKVKDNLEIELEVEYSKEWHDRFWITNQKKGIVIGTSLNGIGNKISTINQLDEQDVIDILEYIRS